MNYQLALVQYIYRKLIYNNLHNLHIYITAESSHKQYYVIYV